MLFARGNLAHRTSVGGDDETGVLASTLNRMAQLVEDRTRALREKTAALEEKTAALERSTVELATITANVPVLIAYVDANEHFRFVNEYVRDVFGFSPERVVGRTLRELFGPELYARLDGRLRDVLAGLPQTFETSFTPDGNGPVFIVTCFPDYGEKQEVRGAYVVCQDITRRKEAEEALAARERFIRLIADAIPARITYSDTSERLLFGKPAVRGVSGQRSAGDRRAARRRRRFTRCLCADRARARSQLSGRGATLRPRRRRPRSDAALPGRSRTRCGSAGKRARSRDDFAGRDRAAAGEGGADRIRKAYAPGCRQPAGADRLSERRRALPFQYDARCRQMFGLAPEQLVGRTVRELLSAEAYAQTAPHIEAVRKGKRARFQRTVTRNGRECSELVELIPDQDPCGEVVGFYGLVQDVTDLRDAQAKAEQSEQRLRRITDNIPSMVGYIDRDRRYRFNSHYYATWLARPLSEITGRLVSEVLGHEAYLAVRPNLDRAFTGERVDFDVEVKEADGARFVRGTYIPDSMPPGT